ncbi:MAG: efflux RND transporter permease subunit [bacterium]
MSIVKTSIKQPVLVNLLFAIVLVAGFFYGSTMTKELFPDVEPPGLYVQTFYPGISAREMEKLVTRPIEDAVSDVKGLAHVYSTSADSISFLWLELDPDADIDKAVLDVQSRVNEIRRELPPDIESPVVRPGQMLLPVIQVALVGVARGNPHLLRNTAKALREKLETLTDVDDVMQSGIRERQIRVVAKPEKLEAFGISLAQLAQTLQARNRNLPGGSVITGGKEFAVRAIAEYTSLQDILDAIVVRRPDGRHVRIRHLAEVRDTFAERVTGAWVDGQPGVVLSITKRKGSDAHKVVKRVRQAVREFGSQLPKGYKVKLMGDTTKQVEHSMKILYTNGLLGIVLVLGLLWIFLGVRNAIFAALGIPFALAGGVVMMHIMGVTINQLSLFGLIICIGIIVDDAIVVVENTYRHIEAGQPASVAALLGTKEVMYPVISTILTTIAAFLPLLLMAGVFGKFMATIPKVVVAALVASLIEALIILPSHVADFAKKRRKKTDHGDGPVLVRVKALYRVTFGWALRLRWLTVIAAFVVFGVLLWQVVTKKDVILFAETDGEMLDVRIEMPQGTSLAGTEQVVAQVAEIVRKNIPTDEVVAVISQSGWSRTHLWPATGKHLGMVTVMLTSVSERKRTAQQIISTLRPTLKDVPGPVKPIEVLVLQFKPPTGKPVAIRISGENLQRLLGLAEKVESELARIPGVKDIGRDFHLGSPEYQLKVDESKAALHGLGTAEVASTIMIAYMGFKVSKFRQNDEEMDVVLRYPESYRTDARELSRLAIPLRTALPMGLGGAQAAGLGVGPQSPSSSRMLTLGDVARVERAMGPTQIRRRDRRRTITVTANLDTSVKITSQKANKEAMKRLQTLMKANPDVSFQFGGEWEKTNESLQSLGIAFLIAILVIYLILGAQFQSFLQPFTVLLAVPLASIGVIVGFFVSGNPMDMTALIGFVGLTGIVVNDSLILVDFINQRRRMGMDRDQAIRESGEIRLRPILLTSITTVGGLMPLSLGIGGDVQGLSPMATTIAWGLSFATILVLYIVPAAYGIIDDITAWTYRLFGKELDFQRADLESLDELDRLGTKDAEHRADELYPPASENPEK